MEIRMRITCRHIVKRDSLYRCCNLSYWQIWIKDKRPSQSACLLVYEICEGSCRIECLYKIFLFECEEICIISSIRPPCTPSVRRIEHIRNHQDIILCFPEPHRTSPAAGVVDAQLSQARMCFQDLQHLGLVMFTLLRIFLKQREASHLQSRT